MIIFKLYLILFVCVTVTDRLNFWENMGAEIHRFLLGKRKPVELPYLFRCSLCQTFWVSILYILFFDKLTLLNLALCVFVSAQNQILIQFLNFIEEKIISIFRENNDE